MTKQICEIGTSSWFYYKEISYDARSYERKKCSGSNCQTLLIMRQLLH